MFFPEEQPRLMPKFSILSEQPFIVAALPLYIANPTQLPIWGAVILVRLMMPLSSVQ